MQTWHGRLECRLITDDSLCGTDEFTLTLQSDGTRTLRSMTQQTDRGTQINIVLRVDRDFRPLEGFTTDYMEGEFLGTGLFSVNGNELTALVKTPERQSLETLEVPERFSLLMHPVSADGWHFGSYDMQRGGPQTATRCSVGGARESVRCALSEFTLEYLGDETIEVPAGKFDTQRFRMGENTEVWLAGEHRIMVQHVYRTFGTRYRLVALDGMP